MSRLLRRHLTLAAAAGVALAAPSLILPSCNVVRWGEAAFMRNGAQHVPTLDVLLVAGHFAPGFIGSAAASDGPPATFIAVSANGAGTSAAMPSGWAAGDLLILVATAYKSGSSTIGHVTPSGWTLLSSHTHGYAGGGFQARTRVFYRIAQTGDTTVTLTRSDGSTAWASCMLAYRGANAASPFEAVSVLSDQSAASSIPYAEIAIGANCVVLQIVSSWPASPVSASPDASWTERFDSANSLGVSIDERTFTSAVTTPAGNQTRDHSGPWGRIAFAVKPA